MDKARHPHVVRTWTVERTKVLYRPPQPAPFRPSQDRQNLRGPSKPLRGPRGGQGGG